MAMAFKDGLIDSASFFTITTSKTEAGQEVKEEAALYSNIPCRFALQSRFPIIESPPGNFEKVTKRYSLQVEPEYNGANQGDKAVVNNQNYTVTEKREVRGTTSTIKLVVYYLDEKS